MLENGPRGLDHLASDQDNLTEADIEGYGIDWEAMENEQVMAHFFAHNEFNPDSNNPPLPEGVDIDQGVVVNAPEVPLEVDLANVIEADVAREGYLTSKPLS
ncbi:hypothetical protein RhiLY_05488 [Ceratobasidium sp. AG-Ba]|nr:hypothetical protein RhiLY_05488 [Ceratobasidium sp. AG-Ba]